MANDDAQDKHLEPTERKKRQALEKGQIARSRDLNTAMIMISGIVMISFFSKHIVDCLLDNMQTAFTMAYSESRDMSNIGAMGKHFLNKTVIALLPFFIIMTIFALVGPAMISGIKILPKAMKLKTEKLNIFKGIKKIFSMQSMMELIKSFAKFVVILAVAVGILVISADQLVMLGRLPIEKAMLGSFETLRFALLMLAGSLLLFAAIDVPFQIWDNNRKLKMSHKEMKDEMKDSEGNPEVKQALKRKQQHLARQRMLVELPKATLIITNPEHYAVALKYDETGNSAPQVVAKGVDWFAQYIKQVGQIHHIPIMSAPPLARAIYYSTETFQEIPGGLYQAVAKILAYVYQLKAYQSGKTAAPVMPADLPIPDELRRDK